VPSVVTLLFSLIKFELSFSACCRWLIWGTAIGLLLWLNWIGALAWQSECWVLVSSWRLCLCRLLEKGWFVNGDHCGQVNIIFLSPEMTTISQGVGSFLLWETISNRQSSDSL
jgi:hypothetical protein